MELHFTATECYLPYGITVLPSTAHKRTHPALTTTIQAGTRFTDPKRMEKGANSNWPTVVTRPPAASGTRTPTSRSLVVHANH